MPDQFPSDLERVMIVGAHPDDMEFGAGGSVALLSRMGVEVTLLVVTAGNRGGEGEQAEDDLAETRREEQAAACRALGVARIENLGYDDGSVEPSLALRKDLVRKIRTHRPNLVITHNPVRHFGMIGGNHPDHLAVGEATFAAIYPTARNPMALPELLRDEGLDKWVVDWLWAWGTEHADHFVDITSVIDTKIEALLCHRSQLGPEVADWVKLMAGERAQAAAAKGYGEPAFAESFRQMFTGELRRPPAFTPGDGAAPPAEAPAGAE